MSEIVCDTCGHTYDSEIEDYCPKCGDDNEEQKQEQEYE